MARRDFNSSLVEESDSTQMIQELRSSCASGDLLIVPRGDAKEFQDTFVLAADEHWALVRNP